MSFCGAFSGAEARSGRRRSAPRGSPLTVAGLVSEKLGVKFSNLGHHVAAWRYYEVRPDKNAARPELTDDRYCVWDEPHKDYLYTEAWVKKLVKDLADPDAFESVTGKRPVPLPKAAAPVARAA
jgi:hypothetical protein